MRSTLLALAACLTLTGSAHAQQFNFYLCYAPTAYEQNYVYFHQTYGTLPPFAVCTYTPAQMVALNAQLRAKYGY